MKLPEVIGKTCRNLGYEQWHHDMHMREIAQVIQTKLPLKGEVPFKAPRTGVFGIYEYIFTPVLSPDGTVELVAGTTRDITERKRAEEALARAQEQLHDHARTLEATVQERTAKLRETIADLEQFSYSISHDMRAPLRTMNAFSTFLLQEYGERLDSTASDYLQRIAASAQRLDDLIRDVLSYSQVAKADLVLASVDLDDLVAEVIRGYPQFHPDKVRIEIMHPLLPALGNVPILTQCVSNLLGNAVKFVSQGTPPQVRIWTEHREAWVRFNVCDNGIGIDPAVVGKIWRLFERGHHANEYPGTGIGLSIVHRAVERMGGRVGVESELGTGSTFWIELKKP